MSNKNILALITNMSVTLNLVVPDGLVSLGRSIEGGGISRLRGKGQGLIFPLSFVFRHHHTVYDL